MERPTQETHNMSFNPICGIKDFDDHPRILLFLFLCLFPFICGSLPISGPLCALVGSVDWYAAGIFGSR